MGNGLKEDGFGYYFVVNPDWSETDNSGSYLQHVKELSVNRNSICALVADDEVHPEENNIYCREFLFSVRWVLITVKIINCQIRIQFLINLSTGPSLRY